MNALLILFSLPFILLCLMFVGIVKKNKRLWITSLIFFIVITLAEIAFFVPVYETHPESIVQETITTD